MGIKACTCPTASSIAAWPSAICSTCACVAAGTGRFSRAVLIAASSERDWDWLARMDETLAVRKTPMRAMSVRRTTIAVSTP